MWYQLSLFPSSNAAIAMQHHPGHIHQSVPTPRYSATPWYVFLEFGRCRAKARSLHEHKQSKRRLYKDTVGPYTQANQSRTTKKNTKDHQNTTTRKSPSQTCVSPEKTGKQPAKQTRQTKGAGARTKHPQVRFAKGHSGLTTASLSKKREK